MGPTRADLTLGPHGPHIQTEAVGGKRAAHGRSISIAPQTQTNPNDLNWFKWWSPMVARVAKGCKLATSIKTQQQTGHRPQPPSLPLLQLRQPRLLSHPEALHTDLPGSLLHHPSD